MLLLLKNLSIFYKENCKINTVGHFGQFSQISVTADLYEKEEKKESRRAAFLKPQQRSPLKHHNPGRTANLFTIVLQIISTVSSRHYRSTMLLMSKCHFLSWSLSSVFRQPHKLVIKFAGNKQRVSITCKKDKHWIICMSETWLQLQCFPIGPFSGRHRQLL